MSPCGFREAGLHSAHIGSRVVETRSGRQFCFPVEGTVKIGFVGKYLIFVLD
jgi:tRNA(Phe) wybutosine-synthesizing methylase Tyw3